MEIVPAHGKGIGISRGLEVIFTVPSNLAILSFYNMNFLQNNCFEL